MISASNAFIDALRFGSYIMEAQCTVYADGIPTSYIAPISDCTITIDRNSAQRYSGSLAVELLPTVPPQPLMPVSPDSPISPFGNEVFVQWRATLAGKPKNEWIPIGLFAIATSSVADTSIDLIVSLDLYDRSWLISQAKFIEPYNVPASTGNFVDEITTLLNSVWLRAAPAALPLTYNITPTDATVPTNSYNQGSDPWTAALAMAAAVGYELYFDRNGVVTGYPIPNPATQPTVWQFIGGSSSLLTSTSGEQVGSSPYTTPAATTVTFTRDRIYNDVIVTGTGTQNAPGSSTGQSSPIVARAQDTNPRSPTYVNGPVGDIPEFIQTNIISSSSQATSYAQNELQAALSMAYQVSVDTPPNPLFEVDDVISVTNPRVGLNGTRIVLDTIQMVTRFDATATLTGRVVAS